MLEIAVLEHEGPIIKIVGVGGAGANALENMIRHGLSGAEYIVIDTDAQTLARSTAQRKLQLGETGLGAGANPEVGCAAAKRARNAIRKSLEGAHLLFIVAGMGGGTGSGAAPVIAAIASEMDILTVGVVTTPFDFEGVENKQHGESGVAELVRQSDSLIVIPNEKFMMLMGDDADVDRCFQAIDDLCLHAVGGITGIIMRPGLVNSDYQDLRTVMGNKGLASIGSGIGGGKERARIAALHAIASPLLRENDLATARGIAVIISASRETLKMKVVNEVMNTVKEAASDNANIIFGALYEPNLGETVRVVLVACGIDSMTHPKTPSPTDPMPPGGMGRRIATPGELREAGIDPLQIPDFLRKAS